MAAFRSLRPLLCIGALSAVVATGTPMTPTPTVPGATVAPAALQRRHDPVHNKQLRDDGVFESSNWSGYAITGTNVTAVSGSWVVPQVTCAPGDQYSAFWVGIDGFTSASVEQTGTLSDCAHGAVQNLAWFEFYPQPLFVINTIAVEAGDTMTASVTFSASTSLFTTTVTDVTRGQSYSTSSAVAAALRTSAEWIGEAPSSAHKVLTLADFGTVPFARSAATMAGKSGFIGRFLETPKTSIQASNVVEQVVLVEGSGAGAQPSGFDKFGDFNDVYIPAPTGKQSGKK